MIKPMRLDWKLGRDMGSKIMEPLKSLKDTHYFDSSKFYEIYNKISDSIDWNINDKLHEGLWYHLRAELAEALDE